MTKNGKISKLAKLIFIGLIRGCCNLPVRFGTEAQRKMHCYAFRAWKSETASCGDVFIVKVCVWGEVCCELALLWHKVC